MPNEPTNKLIGEEAAGSILDRAAKLDAARGSALDVEALRAAALEAGISSESFEIALAETRAMQKDPIAAAAPTHGLPSPLYRGAILGMGVAIGALAWFLWRGVGIDDGPAVFISLIISAITAVGLMVKRRRERAVLDFEIDLGVLWAGVTVMLMLSVPADADQVLGAMTLFGGIAAAVGAICVALPPGERPRELPEGS